MVPTLGKPGSDPSNVFRLKPAVQKAASEIGIDLRLDREYLWVAEFAAEMTLPSEWTRIEDENGEAAYYHPKTKRLTKTHPITTKYRHLFDKLKKYKERTGMMDKEAEPYVAMVLNEVLNRCNRELPPMTPEILERMALLFGVNTSEEFSLTRKLKMSTEAYAEDQYDLAVQAHQKADVSTFLHDIRTEQVRIDVLDKPEE